MWKAMKEVEGRPWDGATRPAHLLGIQKAVNQVGLYVIALLADC